MLHKKPNGICSEMMGKVKSIADSIIQIRLDTGESLALASQITDKLNVDYNRFNNLFLSECGMTIERVYMMRIVEKTKELLVYTEQTIAQIAKTLGFGDTYSLSEILEQNTGLTSSHFKAIRKSKLDTIKKQQEEQNEI